MPKIQKNSDWKKEYLKYLSSDEWAKIRADLIEIYGGCQRCGETRNLQVHHLSYDNLFNEEPGDLLLLCAACHMEEHSLVDTRRKQPHRRGKVKPIYYYRAALGMRFKYKVKRCRGWKGLARETAKKHGGYWPGGSKNDARRYVADKF